MDIAFGRMDSHLLTWWTKKDMILTPWSGRERKTAILLCGLFRTFKRNKQISECTDTLIGEKCLKRPNWEGASRDRYKLYHCRALEETGEDPGTLRVRIVTEFYSTTNNCHFPQLLPPCVLVGKEWQPISRNVSSKPGVLLRRKTAGGDRSDGHRMMVK